MTGRLCPMQSALELINDRINNSFGLEKFFIEARLKSKAR
jgi:hypothetical protein